MDFKRKISAIKVAFYKHELEITSQIKENIQRDIEARE